ncbi:hypothetical protein GOBAR_AA23780 [Gossypium barbadense]|uniref:Uncharacterized protein n=1 Tax=Gossypium barbadense TaxID=3634 RepID=A0A2P5X0M5_GOSBA|nr:hypothetical protein GOBAR_AA23780 [Gossypium barbadense]
MGKSTQTGGATQKFSDLLELSASNDLISFRIAIEEEGHDIDEPSLWYGRRIGTKKMGFEERTPLLIASIFGCKDVVNYIIKIGLVDVNRACGSDGARALHCAAASGSSGSPEIVKILLNACADINSVDANGNRPGDLIAPASCNSDCSSRKKLLEALLKSNVDGGEGFPFRVGNEMDVSEVQVDSIHRVWKDGNEKKLQSPTGVPKWQNLNQQLRASYPTNLASSPIMMSPTFGVETSGPTAASSLSSKRSPSVIECPAGNRNSGFSTPASPVGAMPPNLSDWGSVDGKLDWGIQGEELKKLRKSASLVFLNNSSNLPNTARSLPSTSEEPEASRVQPHMNGSTHSAGQVRPEDQKQQKCHNTGNSDMLSAWMEQLYKDQDQILN